MCVWPERHVTFAGESIVRDVALPMPERGTQELHMCEREKDTSSRWLIYASSRVAVCVAGSVLLLLHLAISPRVYI